MMLDRTTIDTPLGPVLLLAQGSRLVGLEFSDRARRVGRLRRHLARTLGTYEERDHRDPAGAATRLRRYFKGDVRALDEQPVEWLGTPFQRAVWQALRRIPVGRTRSYGDMARAIGRPKAVRAVGAANGANPIALFVPCHRVVASDGSPHGYGGGIERKVWLLSRESKRAARRAR
jgi:methylated-DNA-[protein]-cysteine S-methyltransferase